MDLSFMQNELVHALCWTLIHSLWQGLLLAIVTGAVMIGTRRSDARKRYGLLTFLFFLFMVVTVVTFVKELHLVPGGNAGVVSNIIIKEVPVISAATPVDISDTVVSRSMLERFKDYFNTHASLIVMIWFVIFIARFIKLTAGLVYVQRLKHYKIYTPAEEWKDKVDELILILGIRKQIQLLESGIVKVPVVMGIFKPVILLPLGLLAHLPADEIEAILLHELAHIQRKDYFMNLMQSFAETIFFFNPALMWLSSMIREERENCCDDIAISITNSKSKFINALIAFQEYNFSTASYTIGFPGKKDQLLNRVKRIISDRNKTLNATEKSLLTFGMGVLILFSFAAAKKITPVAVKAPFVLNSNNTHGSYKRPNSKENSLQVQHLSFEKENTVSSFTETVYTPVLHKSIDTVPSKMKTSQNNPGTVQHDDRVIFDSKIYSARDSVSNLFDDISIHVNKDYNNDATISAIKKDGTTYKIRKIDGVLTELYVDNKQVTGNDLTAYAAVIDNIEKTIQYRQDKFLARLDANRRQMLLDKQMRVTDEQRKALNKHLINVESERVADRQRVIIHDTAVQYSKTQIFRDNKSKINEQLRMNAQQQLSERVKGRVLKDGPVIMDTVELVDSKGTKGRVIVYDTDTRNKKGDTKDVRMRKVEAIRQRETQDNERMQESAGKIRNIIKDLEIEGIKINMETGWFALDKDQFIVDGKKISPALREKFRNKYIKTKDGWGYYYGPIQVAGRGVFLNHKNLVK